MGAIFAVAAEFFGGAAAAEGAAAIGTAAATAGATEVGLAAAGATVAEAGAAGAALGGSIAGTAAAGAAIGGGSLLGSIGTGIAVGIGTQAVMGLLAPNPKSLAPNLAPQPTMPDPLAQQEAAKKSLVTQMARRGRASTILTNDSGGSGSGKLGG